MRMERNASMKERFIQERDCQNSKTIDIEFTWRHYDRLFLQNDDDDDYDNNNNNITDNYLYIDSQKFSNIKTN